MFWIRTTEIQCLASIKEQTASGCLGVINPLSLCDWGLKTTWQLGNFFKQKNLYEGDTAY